MCHPPGFLVRFLVLILASQASLAAVAVTYDESSNGDLSGSNSAPTNWGALPSGTHSLIGTVNIPDKDYVTLNIPNGLSLSKLIMVSYDSNNSGDERAFIGVQGGTVMTVPPTTPSAAGLLGWAHFGPADGNVGSDILPAMGASGVGATGFTPPLPSGDYTFWIQQVDGFELTAYRFDFTVSAPNIVGDYSGDGVVDAADYVAWRKTDINGPQGYADWRGNFGVTAGAGAFAGTPEPTTLWLAAAGLAAFAARCRPA